MAEAGCGRAALNRPRTEPMVLSDETFQPGETSMRQAVRTTARTPVVLALALLR